MMNCLGHWFEPSRYSEKYVLSMIRYFNFLYVNGSHTKPEVFPRFDWVFHFQDSLIESSISKTLLYSLSFLSLSYSVYHFQDSPIESFISKTLLLNISFSRLSYWVIHFHDSLIESLISMTLWLSLWFLWLSDWVSDFYDSLIESLISMTLWLSLQFLWLSDWIVKKGLGCGRYYSQYTGLSGML